MKKVMAAGMVAALLCFSQTGCSGDAVVKEVVDQAANVAQAENENVLAVKGGEPFAYPGKTYGNAFESFFDYSARSAHAPKCVRRMEVFISPACKVYRRWWR